MTFFVMLDRIRVAPIVLLLLTIGLLSQHVRLAFWQPRQGWDMLLRLLVITRNA